MYRQLTKANPLSLYLYSMKPVLARGIISLLRKTVHFEALTITSSDCIVDTGTAKFYWEPGNAYSMLGYPFRGDFEKTETDITVKIASSARCVVDVGGNFGWFACQWQAVMPAGSQLHVFEPVPAERSRLQKNLALNTRNDVTTIVNDVCLSEAPGEVQLHIPKKLGAAFASMSEQSYGGEFEVVTARSTTLDDYCKNRQLDHIDLLKIDVEGAELLVLRGARTILQAAAKPVILIESQASTIETFGSTVPEVLNFIKSLGYRGFVFQKDRLQELTDRNIETGYNYLFVDEQKAGSLRSFLEKKLTV
ncbi:MAG: hypothetical protein A2078_00970 [Nitrospirae bacterium GWC2_57_9]|nr:MAG: hypothetical protein A2078_00970 [Nitrospirae bacterium GWC2_57_9]